eukprot:6833940-Prorocentrum_lima.AAC.1
MTQLDLALAFVRHVSSAKIEDTVKELQAALDLIPETSTTQGTKPAHGLNPLAAEFTPMSTVEPAAKRV